MKRSRAWLSMLSCTAAALVGAQSVPEAAQARDAAEQAAAAPEAAESNERSRGALDPNLEVRGAANGGDLERLLGDLERKERETRARFDELGRIADAASGRVLARGRAYVRFSRAGLLPVGDGFEALVEHATKLERWRHALGRDVSEQKSATAERARLARTLEDLSQRLAPLRAEQRALEQARTQVLAAADRQRAFERAFQSSTGGEHTAVYGAAGPSDPSELAAGFASMNGRLPFPLTGRSEIERARRSTSEGGALAMRAPLGSAVRAVFPGRVAFADAYADYGKTVIVDHGDRHYTVSGNLATIEVQVGDDVTTTTRLGTVGDSGQGALLYFELRVGSRTVDASTWFGL